MPFVILGQLEGGVGNAARIKFKVATQHMPSACTDNAFENISTNEDWYVPLSPTMTIGQLCKKPVTLTGKANFSVNNLNGLIGTVECNYQVGIRPSNGAGD